MDGIGNYGRIASEPYITNSKNLICYLQESSRRPRALKYVFTANPTLSIQNKQTCHY